ncbi:MAG TPA: hypothetical protein VE953_13450 [Terriglobales bacterium]|nr:hypothetical protein [Terriglobales bacterium]
MTQNLPIGAVTSPHAVRLRRSPSAWLPRVRLHVLLMLAGVAAATAGAVVSAEPGQVTVRWSAGTYEIGGARLSATAPGVYQGPGGAAVVLVHANGATRAGASATVAGAHTTGSCTLVDGARTETCEFTIAGTRLGATDTWTGGGWHRRYADGRTSDITVAGGAPVPVPLAVGR